jgi:hypothetical protein
MCRTNAQDVAKLWIENNFFAGADVNSITVLASNASFTEAIVTNQGVGFGDSFLKMFVGSRTNSSTEIVSVLCCAVFFVVEHLALVALLSHKRRFIVTPFCLWDTRENWC